MNRFGVIALWFKGVLQEYIKIERTYPSIYFYCLYSIKKQCFNARI